MQVCMLTGFETTSHCEQSTSRSCSSSYWDTINAHCFHQSMTSTLFQANKLTIYLLLAALEHQSGMQICMLLLEVCPLVEARNVRVGGGGERRRGEAEGGNNGNATGASCLARGRRSQNDWQQRQSMRCVFAAVKRRQTDLCVWDLP